MINDSSEYIQNKLVLPCGAVIKNRLAKSPMSDALGNGEGNPTEEQSCLYEKWASGGVALSFVGEVQVDPGFPEKPGNLVLGEDSEQEKFKSFTSRAVINEAHLWAQLGQAGALSHLPISHPKGPSALNIEGLTCAGMSIDEVQELPFLYARTALKAKEVGFSGVHIHSGHGFLLSQFLSPLFNHRTDGYGGAIENRCRIIIEIIQEVRRTVGDFFPIGIRINSSDLLQGGLTESDSLELVRFLDKTSIDLIDISGGTYFPGAKASSDGLSNSPYFLNFARIARQATSVPLMLTGGFQQREQAIEVIANDIVDMVGLGRAMVLNPRLPNFWLNGEDIKPEFPRFIKTIPGGVTAWYTMRIIALGENKEDEFDLDLHTALREYEKRVAQQSAKWQKKFSQIL